MFVNMIRALSGSTQNNKYFRLVLSLYSGHLDVFDFNFQFNFKMNFLYANWL